MFLWDTIQDNCYDSGVVYILGVYLKLIFSILYPYNQTVWKIIIIIDIVIKYV